MTDTDKLQKAVELTINAGYQLNKEAFEFLTMISTTEDPTTIMQQALKQINTLQEKPLFIERHLLEQILKPLEPNKEIINQNLQPQTPTTTELIKPIHNYARETTPNIKILDDPGSNIDTSATVDDFLHYFQSRFKQMEKLLRQRMDVKSATSLMNIKNSPPNTRLKTIAMITEKRDSKQKTILTIEDMTTTTTTLIPQNATEQLQKKAQTLMLDQVVCLELLKTRNDLLVTQDITLPDVAQRPPHKATTPIYAVLTSDLHIGSKLFTREAFHRFILWLNGKYGNQKEREIAAHVKYVLIAGDIVDGIGIYPNQAKELAIKDINRQYRLASKYLEQIPDYIEVIITPGNHDAPRKALPQPPIKNTFLQTLQETHAIHSHGNPCTLNLHGVDILMFHGRSLDDVISTVPGMNHNHPAKSMQLLLQARHLAPLYGGKTPISPEDKDSLVIEHTPDILHAGHVHALEHLNYRGILIVNSGCWQEQTNYMRRNGFKPTPARVPVVNLQTLELTIVPFDQNPTRAAEPASTQQKG